LLDIKIIIIKKKVSICITECHKIRGTGAWWAPNSQVEIMLTIFFFFGMRLFARYENIKVRKLAFV
jgi:hypothetical protein